MYITRVFKRTTNNLDPVVSSVLTFDYVDVKPHTSLNCRDEGDGNEEVCNVLRT